MSKRVIKKRAVIILILLACAAVAAFFILQNWTKPKFEYDGWINCMPLMDGKQAELCRQAEEAHYPYIAY
jgi:hypothetical protein